MRGIGNDEWETREKVKILYTHFRKIQWFRGKKGKIFKKDEKKAKNSGAGPCKKIKIG
jgi:hypothetical protein